ncbi:uncharacterized protein PRCAT00005990001 [Priceomyces carsonii]|uniref:uncharacterized protein n=1 Tax=Priceomyces carsonii TaxID=28549 RepID=UPI002EDBB554|nr:unnamed protein product [Priceomyces carsonii]
MGVTGLLQYLKEIHEPSSLERYRGKTLAIDTYGWLHRGLISCAQELCNDLPTRKYITSILNKVEMLRHFGVEPYFVFDGAALPTKADTANERRLRRVEARKKAEQFTKSGNKKLAWKEYMKAACVTAEMAKSIMVELDRLNIKYIVAPYEADPQMVYLEKIGLVDGILSEDSDLLIFGCNKLITKLKDDATCVEICRENFIKIKKVPYLRTFSQEQLRIVAMLSGCDYTKGISNIGLKTAFSLVAKFLDLKRILLALKSDGKSFPDDFYEEVMKADLAFQFQKVFNPITDELKSLNEYPKEFEVDFELIENCCGETLDNNLQSQISRGKLHPTSHTILVSREQSLQKLKSESFGDFRSQSLKMKQARTISAPGKSHFKSIDRYFTAGKKASSASSADKKRELVNDKSDDQCANKKLKIMSRSEKHMGRSRYFGTKEYQDMEEKQAKVVEETNWDCSIISGDSDIPDEFSSPLVRNDIKHNLISESTMSQLLLGDTDSEETTSKVVSDFQLSKSLDEANFEVFDEDDEIEESPTKKENASSDLTKFAQVLRQKYVFSESATGRFAKTYTRAPLEPKDTNIPPQSVKCKDISDQHNKVVSDGLKLAPKNSGSAFPTKNGAQSLQRFAFKN